MFAARDKMKAKMKVIASLLGVQQKYKDDEPSSSMIYWRITQVYMYITFRITSFLQPAFWSIWYSKTLIDN